ncbi:MAG: hypothetical protein EA415_04425 [Sphaerobacteraceae bacterium]|nr:MAG: hypothetical protein EA415_04425 [Sphaerobacteraceae bacterium]
MLVRWIHRFLTEIRKFSRFILNMFNCDVLSPRILNEFRFNWQFHPTCKLRPDLCEFRRDQAPELCNV